MKRKPFRLTYSTVTEESAQNGDHATHGFVTRNLTIPARTYMPNKPAQFRLREALEFCRNHGGTIQTDSWPISKQNPPRWFEFINENPSEVSRGRSATGDETLSVTVSLHPPSNISASSAIRLARLLGLKVRA